MRQVIFFLIVAFGSVLSSCDSGVNSDNYLVKVGEIYEYESLNVTEFVNAEGTYSENLWGDKFTVNCTVTNLAKVASYKDIVIRVSFYSATNSPIGTEEYTIYQVFSPQSSSRVDIDLNKPKDAVAVGWEVISGISLLN